MSTPARASSFASQIAKFTYSPGGSPSRGSPSPRKPTVVVVKKEEVKEEEEEEEYPETPLVAVTEKRLRVEDTYEVSPRKKVKKTYASPEKYAHLKELTDHLREGLDVVFCGINPGQKSAETNTHYGHASNRFWKALHQSGFTDRLLKPSEGVLLPSEYRLGLTNLTSRPTSNASELSRKEQVASVPTVMAKIALFSPRLVVFVGKGIWDIWESVVCREELKRRKIARKLDPPTKDEVQPQAKTRVYRVVFGQEKREVYFTWVASTSGLERTPMDERVADFVRCRDLVASLKAGSLEHLDDIPTINS